MSGEEIEFSTPSTHSIAIDTSRKIRYVSMKMQYGLVFNGLLLLDEKMEPIAEKEWLHSEEDEWTPL